ncbi:MAG TPA: helix-turn-helix domain-containing protein, partial [Ktedonobacterales bacterium]|nr:helix-turn-helix domain-containing protein [Ktedonobacterales bacterium]
MSPRPYRLGQRQAATDQTRARIVAAAHDLFVTADTAAGFSIDAVAKGADVARMTVYHQFGSKAGLLEALCDSLAAYAGMERLAVAFTQPNALAALDEFIGVFARLWQSDRLVMRRLRGLAMLDPDFERVIRARDERRRQGLRALVPRLSAELGRPDIAARDEVVDILHTLIAFEFFDTLAGPDRSIED